MSFPYYSIYDITHDGVTVPFQITIVDVSAHCQFQTSINLAEFVWKHICVFAVKMFAIVCVPLNTPTVLFLNHHRAVRDVWTSDILCDECLEEFRLILFPFVGNCTSDRSCRCNVCLRQPPSLRSFASYTDFHLTFNSSKFTPTRRTLYHQYLYAVKLNIVPDERLVPLAFSPFKCTFVRDK